MWSSPATASTPPLACTPAKLACLKASPVRSTPGRLAVPHAEHAVVARAGEQVGLLAAPDGGGGQVLVEAFLEDHLGGVQVLARPRGLLVEPAQRRAAIAGDEACRVQPRRLVQPVLVHQDAEQRLDAGDEDPAVREQKFVVERHFVVAHRNFFPFGPPQTRCKII